jgi:hypothetical protein
MMILPWRTWWKLKITINLSKVKFNESRRDMHMQRNESAGKK